MSRFLSIDPFIPTPIWRSVYAIYMLIGLYGCVAFLIAWPVALIGLPSAVEWPTPPYTTAFRTVDGRYVVEIQHVGRIQVYDKNGRFENGITVDTAGGVFDVQKLDNGQLDVYAVRRNTITTFDLTGRVLTTRPAMLGPVGRLPTTPRTDVLPHRASLLFAPLWNPLIAWALAGLCLGLPLLLRRRWNVPLPWEATPCHGKDLVRSKK